jgi:rubrerythrin
MNYIITEDQLKKILDKEKDSKWIKCKNCNKKFTQTIYKGKKSIPMCPTCGTKN